MKALHKQLVLNKREDWQLKLCLNVERKGDALMLAQGAGRGFACLAPIDSGENGFEWRRLTLDCDIPRDSLIRVWAFAADTPVCGEYPSLDALLKSLAPGEPATFDVLAGIYARRGEGEECDLALTGRYLCLMLEFVSSSGTPRVDALRVHIYGDHMTEYLPAIYRRDGDFTRRFLSVFDSILMDMEHEIYALPARFDFEQADGSMLAELSRWVCIEPADRDADALTQSIRTALSDYESMYTVEGVKRSVKRLTGHEPLIIESAAVDPNRQDCADSALYRRLYGENPYKFFVLLGEDVFKTREQMEEFLLQMQGLIPAQTEFELVLLRRCVQLDGHTYLGVNAMVSDYVPVVIDENKTIHYDTMIGGNVN